MLDVALAGIHLCAPSHRLTWTCLSALGGSRLWGKGAFILSTTEMVVSLSQQLEKCGLDLELGTFTHHISPLIKRLVCFI